MPQIFRRIVSVYGAFVRSGTRDVVEKDEVLMEHAEQRKGDERVVVGRARRKSIDLSNRIVRLILNV